MTERRKLTPELELMAEKLIREKRGVTKIFRALGFKTAGPLHTWVTDKPELKALLMQRGRKKG